MKEEEDTADVLNVCRYIRTRLSTIVKETSSRKKRRETKVSFSFLPSPPSQSAEKSRFAG